MQHLFYVHSFINYVVAISIIDYYEIDHESVVFNVQRDIAIDPKWRRFSFSSDIIEHPFNLMYKLPSGSFLKNRKLIQRIDRQINNTVNSDFIFYAPHSVNAIYKIIMTHPQCAGLNFVEDGMDAYLTTTAVAYKFRFDYTWKYRLARFILKLIPNFASHRLPVFNSLMDSQFESTQLFCLSKQAYKFIDNYKVSKVVLPITEKLKKDYSVNRSIPIFIFDAVIEQKVAREEDLIDLIKWWGKKYGEDQIQIKFHPAQKQEEQETIVRAFKASGIEPVVLNKDLIMEAVFVSLTGLIIYGIGSSLLFYGAILGSHSVHVLYPYLELEANYISPRKRVWDDAFLNNHNIKLLGRDF